MTAKDIQTIIRDINETCNALASLSNDELRNKLHEIRSRVVGQGVTLDSVLVDVFAIVKETMKRFSMNTYMDVEATSDEKALANRCDFVSINDNKATFWNSWSVLGEKFTWSMIPYDEQLQGGIEIHKGRILQMATGEGKTLVVIAPAVLNAISGKRVHIMTVNEYLSKRDFEITRPIYSFLGLSVECIEGKAHRSLQRKEAYECDITFGTTSGFVFDYLYDHTALDISECVQNKFGFAIVDEADSVMIDEAETPHLLGGIHYTQNKDENPYEKFLPNVKKLVEQDGMGLYSIDKLRKRATLTEKGKTWLANDCGDPTIFDDGFYNNKIKRIEKDVVLTKAQKEGFVLAEKNSRLEQLKLQNVLCQLLTAFTVYEKDVDYIVSDKRIIIVDPNTGRLKPTHIWEFGLHEAVMAKENISPNASIDNISGTITVKNYLQLYEKLSGMTGTAIAAIDEWRDVYGLDVAVIPTHKPVIRKDYPLRAFATSDQALFAMSQEVAKLHEEQRSVLVGVNSIRQSKKIQSYFEGKGLKPQLLNAKTLGQEASIIAHAGELGCITVATNVAGRGTDIKPSDESLNAGGLAVIGWGIAHSKRIDEQLVGRSGRQGNPGSSQFFVSCEDEIIGFLSPNDKRSLEDLKQHNVSGSGEMADERTVKLFLLAQHNKEEEDKNARAEATKQDDVINPFRRLLYDLRMQLLRKDNQAIESGYKLFDLWENVDFKSEYESHKKKIVEKALPIVKRVLNSMWSVEAFVLIPLMTDGKTFSITCDFRKAIATNGTSIINEIERQSLLTAIDKLWIDFINEINSPLIPLNEYEAIYHMMFVSVKEELKHTLLTMTLPIDCTEDNEPAVSQSHDYFTFLDIDCDTVELEELCPCGSGKTYWQCHGRFTINNNVTSPAYSQE